MLKRAVLCAAILTGCAVAVNAQPITAPTQPNPTQPATTTTTTTMPTTTTTTTITAAPNPVDLAYDAARLEVIAAGRCVELFDAARAGGWPPELMVDVLDEAWHESRCDNTLQPGHPRYNGTDHCALQINAAVHRDYVAQVYGPMTVLATDPAACFGFGWRLYIELEQRGRCGFRPWSRPCK